MKPIKFHRGRKKKNPSPNKQKFPFNLWYFAKVLPLHFVGKFLSCLLANTINGSKKAKFAKIMAWMDGEKHKRTLKNRCLPSETTFEAFLWA